MSNCIPKLQAQINPFFLNLLQSENESNRPPSEVLSPGPSVPKLKYLLSPDSLKNDIAQPKGQGDPSTFNNYEPIKVHFEGRTFFLGCLFWEKRSGSREPLGREHTYWHTSESEEGESRNPCVPPLLPIADRGCPDGLWIASHRPTHSGDSFL